MISVDKLRSTNLYTSGSLPFNGKLIDTDVY